MKQFKDRQIKAQQCLARSTSAPNDPHVLCTTLRALFNVLPELTCPFRRSALHIAQHWLISARLPACAIDAFILILSSIIPCHQQPAKPPAKLVSLNAMTRGLTVGRQALKASPVADDRPLLQRPNFPIWCVSCMSRTARSAPTLTASSVYVRSVARRRRRRWA